MGNREVVAEGAETTIEPQTQEKQQIFLKGLFRMPEEGLKRLTLLTNGGNTYIQETASCIQAYFRFNHQTQERYARLEHKRQELSCVYQELKSSASCGMVYLKMLDEFSPFGLSPKEITDFFLKCLRINSQIYTRIFKGSQDAFEQQLFSQEVLDSREFQRGRQLLVEVAGDPPDWFKGNKGEWVNFVESHGCFKKYLGLKPESSLKPRQILRSDRYDVQAFIFGPTSERGFPDWLTKTIAQEPPTREAIENELNEDLEAINLTGSSFRLIGRQQTDLTGSLFKKAVKTIEYSHKREGELLGNLRHPSSLPEMLILFKLLNAKAIFFHRTPSNLEKLSPEQIGDMSIHPQKLAEQALNFFINEKAGFLSKELIAYWLGSKLNEAGLTDNCFNTGGKELQDIFKLLINDTISLKGQNSRSLSWLKEGNKKAYSFLNYKLKPLLEKLTSDDLTFMRYLLASLSPQDEVEDLIWCISEMLSSIPKPVLVSVSHKKVKELNRSSGVNINSQEAMESLRHYCCRLLESNWLYLYQCLQKTFEFTAQSHTPIQTEREHGHEQLPENSAVAEYVETIDIQTEELKKDGLHGWKVYYCLKSGSYSDKLVEVAGNTLEEREESFKNITLERGITVSVKSSSIIKALEWIADTPQSVEQIRPTQQINAQDYKKVKRAHMRLFYQINHDKKEMVFFVYHKEDWGYRLSA